MLCLDASEVLPGKHIESWPRAAVEGMHVTCQ